MDSLGSGQGGIQYNANTKYIQILSSDGSTWVNWSYYNPQTPVSLIPTDINSDSYTRSDGVLINLSTTGTVTASENPYVCFRHGGQEKHTQMTAPCTITIQFSVPQVITSFEYYNYKSYAAAHVVKVSRSINGATYENLGDFTGSAINAAKNNIAISNPAACKFIRFECVSANYSNSNTFILVDATLYGYSYSA